MSDIDDKLLRKARSGDEDAVVAVLLAREVDLEVIDVVVGWHTSRADFVNRVNARKHYVKRRWVQTPKFACIEELVGRFGLSPNVARHIADGRGYSSVREEAQRQLKAEEDDPTI
jgi:hypothetical protein